MSNKPDWKDAPEWAMWLAMDGFGVWRWFERKPCAYGLDWWPEDGSDVMPAGIRSIVVTPKWPETLEPRPTPKE